MKAERAIGVIILLLALGIGTACEADGAGEAVVWLYAEDGTYVTAIQTEPGTPLVKALNGTMGYVEHWLNIATGYEYPLDKPVDRDVQLRASSVPLPQEPAPARENHDLAYLGIGAGIIVALIVVIGRRFA